MKTTMSVDDKEPKMLRNRVIALILVVSLAGLLTAALRAQGGSGEQTWEQVRGKVTARFEAVRSIRMYFRVDTFTSPELRDKAKLDWQKDMAAKVRAQPSDSNTVEGFFWVADNTRWRCDKTRFYPEMEDNFNQSVYDGEKYYIYRDYFRRSLITNSNNKADPYMFTTISTNYFLGLAPASEYEQGATTDNRKKITFAGHERIGDFDCDKYGFVDGDYHLSLWLCPQQGFTTIKYEEERKDKAGVGAGNVIQVIKVARYKGVVIPTESQQIYWWKEKDKPNLKRMRFFHLQECSANIPLSSSYFQDALRVGTRVVNEIENPGQISFVGGDPSQAIEKVRAGVALPSQEPDTEVNKETTADRIQKNQRASLKTPNNGH